MSGPLVLVSGFGSFEDVEANPSGALALGLAADPPPGTRVRSAVLPVSFARCPAAWDELLAAAPEPPAFVLALGVQREGTFRFERRARASLDARDRRDVDGRTAAESTPSGGRDLGTRVDVEGLVAGLDGVDPAPATVSDDAGGYVCERLYHHVLRRADELGAPALFLHVPPLRLVPLGRQAAFARAVVERWTGLSRA